MPAGAQVVAGSNLPRLLRAPLVQEALAQLHPDAAAARARLEDSARRCGLDPGADLERLVVALYSADEDDFLAVAQGRIDENKLTTCLDDFLASKRQAVRRTRIAGHPAHGSSGEHRAWFVSPAPGHLLVARREQWLQRALTAATPRLASAHDAIGALRGRLAEDRALWGIGLVPADSALAHSLVVFGTARPMTAIYGFVDVDVRVTAELSLVMHSAADARQLVELASARLGLLAPMLALHGLTGVARQLRLSTEGTVARASLTLSRDELIALLRATTRPR
jgi:hypothetical protein